jgi:hypothetical protein
MLDGLRASFWPMNRVASQPEAAQSEVRTRLGELMNQLEAGIAKSSAREAAARPAAPAAVLQAVADPEPQPRNAKTEIVLQVVDTVSSMPAFTEETATEQEDVGPDALSEALRLVTDQRKAAEALLFEAGVLEDRLKDEAQVVQAVRDCSAAKEEADRAAAEAEQAMLTALQKCDVRNAVQAERKELEQLLASKRSEAEAAQAKIAEIERALQEAKDCVTEKQSAVASHELRAKECADKESAAQVEETQAMERMQAINARRDTAQVEAAAAQERAEALKQTLSARRGSNGLEAVQTLAARISEQVKLIKQYRENLSENTAA